LLECRQSFLQLVDLFLHLIDLFLLGGINGLLAQCEWRGRGTQQHQATHEPSVNNPEHDSTSGSESTVAGTGIGAAYSNTLFKWRPSAVGYQLSAIGQKRTHAVSGRAVGRQPMAA
jgi:hypothetical protein